MATKIDYRFVFDSFFFEETLKEDFELQKKLTYITSKASGNRKRQNTISNISRETILKNNPKISLEILRYFMNKVELPEVIEIIEEEIERTIKMAIYLTSEYPNQVIIFTSNDKIEEYRKNPHYQNHKKVSFISGDNAKSFIEVWYNKCYSEVLSSCD